MSAKSCASARFSLSKGFTVSSIGAYAVVCCSQKAGIFKSGVPALTVPQVPAALAELKRVADTVGAPFWVRELILSDLLRYFDLAKLRLQPSFQFACGHAVLSLNHSDRDILLHKLCHHDNSLAYLDVF